jgi:hypothetical protein
VSPAQGALIAALVLVAVTHTMSRVGGALATIGWCAAALVYGVIEFGHRKGGLVFLGIETPAWVFVGAMIGVTAYNGAIVFRALRGRKRSSSAP